MENNSYVNLSLEKYNELYDKAKKFDELVEKFGDKLSDTINTIIDNVNEMFTSNEEEHSGETEELKVGDKVRLIKQTLCTHGFELGDICTIVNIDNITNRITIENGRNKGYVNEKDIKKIKEEK